MLPDHVLQQVLAASFEIIILIVAIVNLSETIHVHLAYK